MYTHKGLDIRLNMGDTVMAAFDGVVRYAKYNRGGFGNLVILRHYNGLETYYAHLSKINVKCNQVVKAGDLIGLVGSTGRSRGPTCTLRSGTKISRWIRIRMIDYDNGKLISKRSPSPNRFSIPTIMMSTPWYHKVRNGDTLGELARKYHTSVKEICAMNKIKSTTTLKIGRTLRVR